MIKFKVKILHTIQPNKGTAYYVKLEKKTVQVKIKLHMYAHCVYAHSCSPDRRVELKLTCECTKYLFNLIALLLIGLKNCWVLNV